MLLHRRFYTDAFTSTLLHTDAFTHKHFYTDAFTLYTTEAFTHRCFYTQKHLHTAHRGNRNFTPVFDDRTSFRAKGLRREPGNSNFTPVFGDRTSFRAKGLRGTTWTRSQFLAIEPHFAWKGCDGNPEIAILPQSLAIEPHLVRKGCAGQVEIAILPQFLAIEPHFVRNAQNLQPLLFSETVLN